MELRQFITLLRRWAWLIVLGTVVAAVSAYIASQLTRPIYQASVALLIDEGTGSETNQYQDILASERLARTYAELLTRRPILEEVIARLELALTPDDLEEAVAIQSVRDTQLIELSVEDPDPFRAAELANMVAQVFQEQNEALQASRYASSKESLASELDALNRQITQTQTMVESFGEPVTPQQEAELIQLQTSLVEYRQSYTTLLQSYEDLRIAEAQSTSNIVVVEPAIPPLKPVRPRPALNTTLAALVGMMLTFGVVSLIEYLDDSLKSPDQITSTLGLPVIGVIARLSDTELKKGPVAAAEARSPITEAYRSLRTNIQFTSMDKPLKTILITSASPQEGKSLTAANLVIVLAQAGLQVVLLDCDLRRPSVHKLFELSNRSGLSDLLLHPSERKNGVLQTTSVANLSLLTTGPLPPNPAEMLVSQRVTKILEQLQSHADVVVVDSPPITAVTDAVIMAGKVDGVLLVVDAGRTRIAAARQAKEQLERAGANIIGVVVNKATAQHGGYYYYHTYSDGSNLNGKGLFRRKGKKSSQPESKGKVANKQGNAKESAPSKR